MQNMPQNDQERIQTLFSVKDYDGIRKMIRDNTADEKINRNDIESAKNIAEILMSYPKAMQSAKGGARFSLSQLKNILVNGRLADINRMNNALATHLRENGEDPYKVIKAGKNTKVEPNLNDFLNTMSNKMVRRTHENTLNAKCTYKGQNMSKANRVEKMAANGERFEQRGKKFFGVTSEGDFKATMGEYNYYKYLTPQDNDANKKPAPKQEQNVAQPQQKAPQKKIDVSKEKSDVIQDDTKANDERSDKKISPKKAVENYLRNFIGQNIKNKATGLVANFGTTGIKKMLSNKAVNKSVANGFTPEQHLEAARNIRELFANAVLSEQHSDRKNAPSIKAIDRFRCDTNVGGEKAVAKITVKETLVDGNKIYSVELEALEKPADFNENTRNSQSTGSNDSTETTGNPSSTNGFSESSSTSTVPQNQQNVKEKKSIIERKTQAKQQDSNSMRKELIEQAAANEDTWANSKKSELHLEDDNDTVVKLTPQELKYYHDLIKKGVVEKPELYKKAPEDVGEMDDNVEMSKEQKQIYDESNGDRDMPNSDSESIEQEENANEHAEQEPRAKYSRDAEKQLDNQGEKADNEDKDIAEFEGIEPIPPAILDKHLTLDEQENVKETVYQQLSDSIKDFSKLVDPVQLDRAFADLPLTRRMRVEFNTKYVQNNEHDKNYYAVRYEHARRCFINDPRIKECIAKYVHEHAKQVRMAKVAQRTLSRSRGTGNKRDVQQTDSKSVVTPSLGEYKGIKEQFDNLIKKHSRDVSAFSFAGNPLSEEALKAKAEFETPLDKLEKVSRERLRKVERNIQDFGKRIGVPVHFVYHPDRGYRGVCIHNGGIYINLNSNVPARSIFMHEFTQHLLLYYIYRKIYLSLNKLAIYKS